MRKTNAAMSRRQTIPFYNPLDASHTNTWPHYKLLMPLCAVGNVGQLACDLIISTLLHANECQLVGRIYSAALMPVVGPNAFQARGPATSSTEVYESKKHQLVIIQQRTSYFKELKAAYISELMQWISSAQFSQLIVLSSSFAQCNPDLSQLHEPASLPIRALTNTLFPSQLEQADAHKWSALNVKLLPDKRQLEVLNDGLSYLPGSGLTKSLLRATQRASIPAAFLIHFCSEGINLSDCYQLVDVLDRYLSLSGEQLQLQQQQQQQLSSRGLAGTATDLKAALQDIERALDDESPKGAGDSASDTPDELTSHAPPTLARRFWVEPYSWKLANAS